jgi:hypothetical protein
LVLLAAGLRAFFAAGDSTVFSSGTSSFFEVLEGFLAPAVLSLGLSSLADLAAFAEGLALTLKAVLAVAVFLSGTGFWGLTGFLVAAVIDVSKVITR